MSAQIVVDISSDEENNAVKSSTKTRSNTKQPPDPTRTAVKFPSGTSPTRDKPTVSPPVTASRSGGPTDTEPRSQSAETCPPQIEQEALKNRAPSAPQIAAPSTSSHPTTTTTPIPPTTDPDPPKPTPLDINAFRHLVSAGSVPVKDSPLILSIQPATPASTNKRKAADSLDDNIITRHPRPPPPPLPATPYTGTSEHPVPPKSNSLLWSVPAYKPPTPTADLATSRNRASATIPPVLKQPSIPNIHAPPTSTSISTPLSSTSLSLSTTPNKTTTTPKPRHRESKWTHAQLANLASALESSFSPTIDAFAAANRKTPRQVKDTYSFLVNRSIFEYSDEAAGGSGAGEWAGTGAVAGTGQGEGVGDGTRARGRGRGKGKVAKRFESELKAYRKGIEGVRKEVHARERREGHWACEGMGMGVGGRRRGRGRGRGGVLEGVVGEKRVGGER